MNSTLQIPADCPRSNSQHVAVLPEAQGARDEADLWVAENHLVKTFACMLFLDRG